MEINQSEEEEASMRSTQKIMTVMKIMKIMISEGENEGTTTKT